MTICLMLMILQCFAIFFKDLARARGKVVA